MLTNVLVVHIEAQNSRKSGGQKHERVGRGINLGYPRSLPGCIHLQNTQRMVHPFRLGLFQTPHRRDGILSPNNGCAYKKVAWAPLLLQFSSGGGGIDKHLENDLNDSTKGQSFALGFTYLNGNKKCKQNGEQIKKGTVFIAYVKKEWKKERNRSRWEESSLPLLGLSQ